MSGPRPACSRGCRRHGWVLVAACGALLTWLRAPGGQDFACHGSITQPQKLPMPRVSRQFVGAQERGRLLRHSPGVVSARAEKESTATEDLSGSALVQSALFLSYFGLQSTMSFYMKWVLSKVKVASNLAGVPAPFLIQSSQQFVGFGLFLFLIIGSRVVGRPYTPKRLKTREEFMLLFGLSVSFTLNIGCNLLSLSLIPLSLTMIIRACTPLSTALTQLLTSKKSDISAGEWACMIAGVLCAVTVVVAQSGGLSGHASAAYFFGVAVAVCSVLCAALDFVFKGILGNKIKLNAIDTTCYAALPIAFMASIMGAVISKPVSGSWALRFAPKMTDLAVFGKLFAVNPGAFAWVLLSGVLAFAYNTFVTFLVVKLSPATAAFAGNFNKAATILVSLLLLEGNLPAGIRGKVMLGAIFGNIVAFTLYNALKKRRSANK